MGRQRKELNRDQRFRIQTLRESGKTYQQIAQQLHVTQRAVQYACTHRFTPQKHYSGRRPNVTTPTRKRIVDFVYENKKNRQLSLLLIPSRL